MTLTVSNVSKPAVTLKVTAVLDGIKHGTESQQPYVNTTAYTKESAHPFT